MTNNLATKIVEEENGECIKNSNFTFFRLDIIGELITKIQSDYIVILYVYTKVSDFFDKKSPLIDSK